MRVLALFFARIFEFWHKYISPAMPTACRYEPSCSLYAAEALRTHGLFRGTWLALRRISRCHPWGGFGHDPVPLRQGNVVAEEGLHP